ncbi:MAG TPA: hypothetical protein VIL12_04395 [Acidimicrobiia bacterium]
MGLAPDDVLMSRDTYVALRDGVSLLESALEDADRDLREGVDAENVLESLRSAALPLVRAGSDPRAFGVD